jgi:nitroreductase
MIIALEFENVPAVKIADASAGLHPLIRHRWSPWAFSERPVGNEELRLLLEAARWAPSSANEQPWRFIVAPRSDEPAHSKLIDTVVPKNREWAESAPVLMLTVAKTTFSHNGSPNPYAFHDVGLAMGTVLTQATALGLSLHQMGGFDREKARANFQIPEGYDPVAVTAIGYAGSPDSLPERLKQQSSTPRQRKSLNELAFGSEWEQPASLLNATNPTLVF